MTEHQHVADWQKTEQIKQWSDRDARQKRLVEQWMELEWQTIVFGQLVQGELKQVNYACDVVFPLDVPHGNKTLHIEGPFEEFLPVEGKP
jgi:hypothetical protein